MPGGIASSVGQGTASPGLTIALVGIALTCSQGDLSTGEQNARALTGQAITVSQGSVSTDRHGLAAEVLQGAFGKSSTVPLTGTAITSGHGTVTPNKDGTVQLAGQAVAIGQGTIIAGKGEALTGSAITSAQQAIAPTLRPTDIVGQAVVSASGTLSASSDDLTVHLSGHEAVFEQGSVLVGGQTIAGSASTSATGTATPDTTVALTGSASACAQGSLTAAQEASEDTFITSGHGSVTGALEIALVGLESVGEQGSVVITGDVSDSLIGEGSTSAVGTTAPDLMVALTGQQITGVQYNVGAPGFAALTGAEVAVIAGDLFTTNDRTFALSGVGMTAAHGSMVAGISPPLSGASLGSAPGDFFAQPDRKALVGAQISISQGILRPPVPDRHRGGLARPLVRPPKDILEIYEEEQFAKRELERVVRKAKKLVSVEKVQAARANLEAEGAESLAKEDLAHTIAAILRRARDEDLAKVDDPFSRAEMDARNDEDLLALLL
ncbi:MAG: hypothetical protein IT349_19295 [Candidatus Eisenbacteria bacterium]|nr:hypothetical protein [Candidatus Eisenbacteria bacterium]